MSDEHLRAHLTDGRWHDDCPMCRRRQGGNGTEPDRWAADRRHVVVVLR